ncbi:MAG: hypothetical protein QM610_09875 [Chitinophagaceae bacterium]
MDGKFSETFVVKMKKITKMKKNLFFVWISVSAFFCVQAQIDTAYKRVVGKTVAESFVFQETKTGMAAYEVKDFRGEKTPIVQKLKQYYNGLAKQ